jgi:hypothetical protein
MLWSNGQYANMGLATGVATGGNNPTVRRLTWAAPCVFRAKPTLSFAGSIALLTAALSNLGLSSISFNSSGYNQISIDVNSSSGTTAGNGVMLILDGNTSATYFEASAEL